MNLKHFALLAAFSVLAVSSCSDSESGSARPGAFSPSSGFALSPELAANLPEGMSVEQIESGRKLYSSLGRCQACHGFAGRGSRQGPPLDGKAPWLHQDGSPEGLAQIIKSGVAKPKRYVMPMPPMGGGSLDDEQIQAIAAYLWSLGPHEPSTPPEQHEAGPHDAEDAEDAEDAGEKQGETKEPEEQETGSEAKQETSD